MHCIKEGNNVEAIMPYIDQYGYFVIFFSLMLELIALPFPGQIMMTYVGFLVYQGHLNWFTAILVATSGSCTGITITYYLGRKLRAPVVERYGPLIHFGPKQLDKMSRWYNRHGNIVLMFSYYVPGVRHFTGYFAGVSKLSPKVFMIFAYGGALIWTTTFITFGKLLGPQWDQLQGPAKKYILIGVLVCLILIAAYFCYKFRSQFKHFIIYFSKKIVRLFKRSSSRL